MSRLDSDTFRTNTLTVVGALGYLAAFGIAITEALASGPIPIQVIALILLASASCMGVEFATDFLPIEISTRSKNNDEREGR